MTDIATYMRISSLQVTNEDVDSRTSAVESLKAAWNKVRSPDAIISKAGEVAQAVGGDGIPGAALGAEVQLSIQKFASAYLYEERPLDVGVVAGLAVKELISSQPDASGWLVADVWAASLWSALGFQPALKEPKREALRSALLKVAQNRVVIGADAARQRVAVKDFGEIAVVAGEEARLVETFKKATSATIDALRRNAALDREELDFLWWSQLGRSRLLDRPFSQISEPARLVARGIEGAAYLRRLPTEAHRQVVLRPVDENPELSLAELLKDLGEHRISLGQGFANTIVQDQPIAFPLLQALLMGSSSADGADVERTAEEWGARALLEASLLKIKTDGPAKL